MKQQTDPQDEQVILVVPPVADEDLAQEAALLRLCGKTPSLSILRRRAQRYEALLFADELPAHATEMDWGSDPIPSMQTLEQLTGWALHQSAQVAEMVFNFLEQPTDHTLTEVLKELRDQGVVQPADPSPQPTGNGSLTEAILNLLRHRPHSQDELYSFARDSIISKRPEAAVRQILRRLIRAGQVTKETPNDVYRLS